MPAQIILVHDDPDFLANAVAALEEGGHRVLGLSHPMIVLDLLKNAQAVHVLITRINFGEGKLHGVALARMVRLRQRSVKVLFVEQEENATLTADEGGFIPYPVSLPWLVRVVDELLNQPPTAGSALSS